MSTPAAAEHSQWMQRALEEAQLASSQGEVPIGAVIVRHGEIVGAAHNQVEQLRDATAHAEVLAIRLAAQRLKKWRLDECTLVVTLEPCAMCLGAARLSRIATIVYGASDSRFGAITPSEPLVNNPRLGPVPVIIGGVGSENALELMRAFFESLRAEKK